MSEYEITSPDGRQFIVNAPEGASQEQILAYVKDNLPPPPEPGATGLVQSVAEVGAGLSPVGAAERVGKALAPSVLPTAGAVALPAAATAVAGPANMPFIPLERGVGSGLGEAANQLFGITEPSMKQIAIATGLPMVLEYTANLVRTLPHAIGPGTLNTLAPKEAASKVAGFRGTVKPDDLFAQAGAEGGIVPATHTKALMASVLNNKNISSAEKKAFRKVLNDSGLSEFLSEDVRGLNPARLQRVLNATGELVSGAEGYEGGHLKRLFGALSDDLDKAASGVASLTPQQIGMKEAAIRQAQKEGVELSQSGNLILYHGTKSGDAINQSGVLKSGSFLTSDRSVAVRYAEQAQQAGKPSVIQVEVPPQTVFPSGLAKEPYWSLNEPVPIRPSGNAAATLKQARDVFKREKVLDAIDDQIKDAFKINRGQGAQGQFNANKIINTLKDTSEGTGKFFAQAFSKPEQKDMIEFFEFLNKIPGLGAPAGATRGSEAILQNVGKVVGSSTVGGALGFAVGGPPGAAVGTAIGASIPPTIETIKLMNMTWQMQGGRDLLRGLMLNTDGAITPQAIATMGAFLSGQIAQAPERAELGIPSTSTRTAPLEP